LRETKEQSAMYLFAVQVTDQEWSAGKNFMDMEKNE